MNTELEHLLRQLKPTPLAGATRTRIESAVRAATPVIWQRQLPLRWLPMLAAASVVIAILAVARHESDAHVVTAAITMDDDSSIIDDYSSSYWALARHSNDVEALLEAVDRSRRPIPLFSATPQKTSPTRNKP